MTGSQTRDDMMRKISVPAAAMAALIALTGPAFSATYKWVDEKGVVHYTDKMPPDQVEKGSVELDRSGVRVKKTEPAPTAEQRRAKLAEEERQKILAREREIVDRRDRALMQSYGSDDEIELARNRAVATIDSQVQSAQAYSTQLAKRRQELEVKRKAYGDKQVPPAIERELESIAAELAKQDALIADKKRENAAVNARYEADKLRWRELKALADAKEGISSAPTAASRPSTSPATTAAGNAK
jgi:hypothetical protein